MENDERERIERLMESNFEVRKLYNQHLEFEDKLKKFSSQGYLTAAEEVEQRRLKRLKLKGVEMMLKLSSGDVDVAA